MNCFIPSVNNCQPHDHSQQIFVLQMYCWITFSDHFLLLFLLNINYLKGHHSLYCPLIYYTYNPLPQSFFPTSIFPLQLLSHSLSSLNSIICISSINHPKNPNQMDFELIKSVNLTISLKPLKRAFRYERRDSSMKDFIFPMTE